MARDMKKFGWNRRDVIQMSDRAATRIARDGRNVSATTRTQDAYRGPDGTIMSSANNIQEFYNPYHGPDGRFTSANRAAVVVALKKMKSGAAGKRKNAAEAGAAKRKGDAASVAKNAHAAKIQKGKEQSARSQVRAMREAQIAAAKRKLKANIEKSIPSTRKLNAHDKAVKAAAAKRMEAAKAPAPASKSAAKPAVRGKRSQEVVKTVNQYKKAKATPDTRDDAPAARNLAKMRQAQINKAKKKAAETRTTPYGRLGGSRRQAA